MALTFLVVDDREADRELLVSLVRATGNVATVASGGAEALVLAADLRPDVILLDLSMPGTDGCDVLAALAADEDLRDIRVLAVSWFTPDEFRRMHARVEHAAAVTERLHGSLEKPVALAEFIAVIDRLSDDPTAAAR